MKRPEGDAPDLPPVEFGWGPDMRRSLFERGIAKAEANYWRVMEQVQKLPPPDLPQVPISLHTLTEGEFLRVVYGEIPGREMHGEATPPIPEQLPLQQLTTLESILNGAANYLAWKNRIYEREGYAFLHVGYYRNPLTPGGYTDEGFPTYFTYLPDTFSSDSFKYLMAAQSVRRELMERSKNPRRQRERLISVDTEIVIADSSRNVGCNQCRLAEYLLEIFRANVQRLEGLTGNEVDDQERAMFHDLKKWGQASKLVLDQREYHGIIPRFLAIWDIHRIPILPRPK